MPSIPPSARGLRPAPLPPDEAERAEALHQLSILDTPAEHAFDQIVGLAARLYDAPIALLSLVDHDRQWFKARVGIEAQELPRAVAFCAYTILTDRIHVVADATRDVRFKANPLVTAAPGIRFYAGAPVLAGGGHRIGSLCVIDRNPRSDFDDAKATPLASLAAIASEMLEFRRRAVASPLEAAFPSPPPSRLRVLVVDDDAINRFVIGHILEQMGHLPTLAEDGPSGLAELARSRQDLVLLDVMMPGMDGPETARAIRASAQPWADIPLIAATTTPLAQIEERCRAAGIENFLVKPIDQGRLQRILEPFLATARQRASL